MSLPPGFLDELRNRLSLAQVVGRKVMWDQRKSNQSKGDWWAPCPFHQEKTASFHVDDQKGYYYCFGCQAKGDMISFVRETENVDFMEAVRILATEAGLSMPERDPQAQQKADRRELLGEVMEKAVRFFRMALNSGSGRDAREYLTGRGLGDAALDRWEIGFAADAWQGLWDHLAGQGVEPQLILDAGLAKPSQKGGKPYDTFRGRIMFPIRDARGRCIAFGGRAMDPNDNAKYLNSPETLLFDKGRSLFNHGPARAAVGRGQPLIVAEGYMDVIALAEAGFEGAVAPLGTAITEHQLAMLWRMAPEPVIALDGDKAGLRAAYRAVDIALPLIQAGKSLRFALMPQGMDPDDLLRAKGPEAVRTVLDGALPMVQLLWQRETEGLTLDSPERRAALDKALRDRLNTIQDPLIRSHYDQAVKDLRWELFRRKREDKPWRGRNAPDHATAGTRSSALAQGTLSEDGLREAVILAVLIKNPDLIPEFLAPLEELQCSEANHEDLRQVLLMAAPDITDAELRAQIAPATLDAVLARPHVAIISAVRRPDPDKARQCLHTEFALLAARRGHAQEMAEALQDLAQSPDAHVARRLVLSVRDRERAGKSGANADNTEFVIGGNGASISREEQGALDRLIEQIDYSKGRKR